MDPEALDGCLDEIAFTSLERQKVLWRTRRNFHRHEVPVAGRQLADGKLPNDKLLSVKAVTTARQFLAEQLAGGESASIVAQDCIKRSAQCVGELLDETGRSSPAHFR